MVKYPASLTSLFRVSEVQTSELLSLPSKGRNEINHLPQFEISKRFQAPRKLYLILLNIQLKTTRPLHICLNGAKPQRAAHKQLLLDPSSG